MEANESFAEWLDGEEFHTPCMDYRSALMRSAVTPSDHFRLLVAAIKREHAKENADLLAALQEAELELDRFNGPADSLERIRAALRKATA